MALAECNTTVDDSGRELLEHGTVSFPVACYQDDFRVCDVPWHWHEEWEAVIITQGSCLVAAGHQKKLLTAGEGFFIHSGVLHGCWDEENSGCMFHSIVFHPRLVSGGSDSIFHRQYVRPLLDCSGSEYILLTPGIDWQNKALQAIETAWQHCATEPPGFHFHVRNALSSLVYCLQSHCAVSVAPENEKTIRNARRIKTMLSHIHSNYRNELDIASIAASAALSESECLRCFRTAIGTTPIQYLKQYRLRQAAHLLESSEIKVCEIAARCGFQDVSYFTKSFREHLGTTPTQYRVKTSG